jgi:hypothetical protein
VGAQLRTRRARHAAAAAGGGAGHHGRHPRGAPSIRTRTKPS